MSEPTAPAEEAVSDADAGASTDHAATAVAEPETPLFEDNELSQFDADDVEAGTAICKMLSLFFLYTVLAMAIVGIWTYSSVFQG